MSEYEQMITSRPHIEVIPNETLNEMQCYQLEHLLREVTLKYLSYIGIEFPGVMGGKNTGVNCYAPLEFRDKCGMSVISLSDLGSQAGSGKMQELKESILGEMEEFQSEYRKYSESSVDYHGGRADAMETAMRIVKVAFRKAMEKEVVS